MNTKRSLLILLGLGVIAGAIYAGISYFRPAAVEANAPLTSRVQKRNLNIVLLEEGSLQPYHYDEIKINTEAIKEFQVENSVSNGTSVKKGDVILRLDETEVVNRIEDTKVNLESARNGLLYAKEEKKKSLLDARLNIRDAEFQLELARKNLDKFLNMKHDQNLEEKKMAVRQARVKIDEMEDDLNAAKKMYKKGLISSAQLDRARIDLENAKFDLRKAEMQLKIYKSHTYPIRKLELQNAVESKQKLLESRRSFFEAVEKQKQSDVKKARAKLENVREKLNQLKEDRKMLVVHAPSSGILNYGSPGEGRRWRRNDDSNLKPGGTVKAGRTLMYIPDLNDMYVHVPIDETDISKLLKSGKSEDKGDSGKINSKNLQNLDPETITTAFDTANRQALRSLSEKVNYRSIISNGSIKKGIQQLNKQEKEVLASFISRQLDSLQSRRFKRLPANVTSESFPNVIINGTVDYVAGAASEESWWSDVKKFDTKINLDQHYEWYRPGMNMKVEILIEETGSVPTVPVEAVFSREGKLFCYRRKEDGTFEEIRITTGQSDGDYTVITSGTLKEGDKIALSRPAEDNIVGTLD